MPKGKSTTTPAAPSRRKAKVEEEEAYEPTLDEQKSAVFTVLNEAAEVCAEALEFKLPHDEAILYTHLVKVEDAISGLFKAEHQINRTRREAEAPIIENAGNARTKLSV